MPKLIITIDQDPKDKAMSKAKSLGLSLSAYVRMLIAKDVRE